MVNVAQIGCGYWGPNLLRNFVQSNNCNVKMVADINEEKLNYVKRTYPFITTTKRFEEILENDEIDAVVVSTPASSHYEISKEVIKKGKHILIEKPIALSSSNAIHLIDLAEKNKIVLMVGHTFEYNSAVHTLRSYVVNGELGKIYYIYSQRLNLGIIRNDVNAMWNLAIHDISILLYVLKLKPISVSVKGVSYIQPNIEDIVFMTINFENDVIANIHVSWLDPQKVRKMTFVGSKKMIIYDDVSDYKIQIFDKGIDKKNISNSLGDFDDFGKFQLIHRAGDVFIPKIDFVEPLKVECEHFLHCIMNNDTPVSDGYDGLRVVSILEAGQESLNKNGKEISIGKL